MAYVYEHWRPDKNICFYVGKGTGQRKNVISRRRGHYYKEILTKLTYLGLKVKVKVIADGLLEEEAYALECKRIAYWQVRGVKLANMSVGGRGGTSGVKRSLSSRRKQSAKMRGRKFSEEHLEALKAAARSKERIEFYRKLHTGRKRSEETKARISAGVKKAWASPRHRANLVEGIRKAARPASKKTRAKQSAVRSTPEAKARLRELANRQWASPECRKRLIDGMHNYWNGVL